MRYLTFLFLLLVALCSAQPANDDCANAIAVNLSETVDFQTLGATIDGPAHPGLPCFSFGDSLIHHDVWYTFTASISEYVEWTTCGTAEFDTRLAVYSSLNACTFGEPDLLYCNDDGVDCSGFTSYLYFQAQAGETYYLRLGGYQTGDFGSGEFIINPIANPDVPLNSNCSEHTFVGVITPEQADVNEGWKIGNNFNALQETEVEAPDCVPQGEFYDVWYSFQNGSNDSIEIRFETLTEDALFSIQVYDSCGLKALNQNDGGDLLDVCFLSSSVESGSMWLIGFTEPEEYILQISTQITNDLPGEFRFQLVGQTEAVSVSELDMNSYIHVYPNPAEDFIQISSPLNSGVLNIVDLSGKTILIEKFFTNHISLEVSSLTPGMYVLQLENKRSKFRSKFFVK